MFPRSAALLDDFNRANENPLTKSGAWLLMANPVLTSDLKVVSNKCQCVSATGMGGRYWNTSQFGPDVEVYVSVPQIDSGFFTASEMQLYLGLASPGTAATGYYLRVNLAASGQSVDIRRIDADGSHPAIGTPLSLVDTPAVAAGDTYGFRRKGSSFYGYYKPSGGAWKLMVTADEKTYTGAGYVGIGLADFNGGTPPLLDDFYAATLTATLA